MTKASRGAGANNKSDSKLTARQKAVAMFRVAKMSYEVAPSVLYVRVVSALLDSILPIVTVFFAAQTTTALAEAYNGIEGAGRSAIVFVLATAVLGVITATWSSIQRYMTRMASYKLEAAIGDRLVGHFLVLDFWRYDDRETADLLDRSRKFSNVFTYVFETLGRVLTALIALVTSVVALGLVSWWLSALLIVAVVPGLVIHYRLSKERIKHWTGNINSRRKAYNIEWRLTQVQTIAEIRLYGLTQHLINLRRKYVDQDKKERIIIERRFISKEVASTVIEAVAEVTALIYITLQIIAHAQPVGQFVYVQQIISRGLGSLRQAVASFIDIDEDLANLEAYNELMSLPVRGSEGVKLLEAPKSIEVHNVSFNYPNSNTPVLDDVSLTVRAGQHVAIVGENGAGKSTLIKLILGLYLPDKGAVMIDDVLTSDLNISSWHSYIGVLQQESAQFDFAVAKDNITYGDVGRPYSNKRYQAAIKKAEAKEFLDKLPNKDQTYITQWISGSDGSASVALSGGQKQRLALARNFYRDSPVVVLDEPTSAIDALAESRIFKKIFEEKDKTVITVSHRLSTVKRADVIFVLEDGRIVEQGSHSELVKLKGSYYKLFESQL